MPISVSRNVKLDTNGVSISLGDVSDFDASVIGLVAESYNASFAHIGANDFQHLIQSTKSLLAKGYLPLTCVAGVLQDGVTYTSKLQYIDARGRHDLMKLFMPNTDGSGMVLKFMDDNGVIGEHNKKLTGIYRFAAGVASMSILWKKYDSRCIDTTSLGNIVFGKIG